MSAPRPTPPGVVEALACNQQSPDVADVRQRVRCNRPAGHFGSCRLYDPRDFRILAEWSGHLYSVKPHR